MVVILKEVGVSNTDGMCIHGKPLMCCNECYDAFMNEEHKRWIENQKIIRESYDQWHDNYNLYVSICGDPVEPDHP